MYKARVESEFRSRIFGLCMPPGKDGFAKSAACFYKVRQTIRRRQ